MKLEYLGKTTTGNDLIIYPTLQRGNILRISEYSSNCKTIKIQRLPKSITISVWKDVTEIDTSILISILSPPSLPGNSDLIQETVIITADTGETNSVTSANRRVDTIATMPFTRLTTYVVSDSYIQIRASSPDRNILVKRIDKGTQATASFENTVNILNAGTGTMLEVDGHVFNVLDRDECNVLIEWSNGYGAYDSMEFGAFSMANKIDRVGVSGIANTIVMEVTCIVEEANMEAINDLMTNPYIYVSYGDMRRKQFKCTNKRTAGVTGKGIENKITLQFESI